jgi:hypothetical protein
VDLQEVYYLLHLLLGTTLHLHLHHLIHQVKSYLDMEKLISTSSTTTCDVIVLKT